MSVEFFVELVDWILGAVKVEFIDELDSGMLDRFSVVGAVGSVDAVTTATKKTV